MTTQQKHESLRRALADKGLHNLAELSLDPLGSPVCVLTNCCIYPFDEHLHVRTHTKTYYAPTGHTHMMNVTAAAAVMLMERDVRVIMHVPIEIRERMQQLISLHPNHERCRVVTGSVYDRQIMATVHAAVTDLAGESPVSRVDFCLYDSYASGLARPFLPMFDDDPQVAARLADERTRFLYYFAMLGYDLLTRHGQSELRLICPTALAAKRPSSHLFTDTIHKAVSNVLLRTLGYEMPYYTDKPVRIVEVAPGIVDSGLYDDVSIRRATYEESRIDGFGMDESMMEIHVFPMLSIEDVAAVCVAYLVAHEDESPDRYVAGDVRELTTAGRGAAEVRRLFNEIVSSDNTTITVAAALPEYCYLPGSIWNGLPRAKPGYTPVMLTPIGQHF